MDNEIFKALSLALGLGLLIGLQRERSGSEFGGIRTFPLIALFGAICGILAAEWSAVFAAAGLIAVVAIAVVANIARARKGDDIAGQTTEAAVLLTYALGALLAAGYYAAGIVVGGVAAVLLHFKTRMETFAGSLNDEDVRAFMRFVILSLVVLPMLPDETFGPYDVLNPREIWLMVVLIVGIGLVGYMTYKLIGGKVGVVLNGLVGGLVSSTATTVAYARRAKGAKAGVGAAAVIVVIAWAVSVARAMVEVGIVAPGLIGIAYPPLALLLLAVVIGCALSWMIGRGETDEMPQQHNPAELKSAFIFGAVYAIVIFATAAAREYFGDQAIYAVALISGVVDVDAITLSTARLGAAGRVDPQTVWKVVVLASLANIVFKAGAVLVLGSAALFMRVLPVLGISLGAGAALILLWPD